MKNFRIAMLVLALPCMIFADAESDLRNDLDHTHNSYSGQMQRDFQNRGKHHEDCRSEFNKDISAAVSANPSDLGVSKIKSEFESDKILYTKAAFDQASTTAKDLNDTLNIEASNIE